MISNLARDLTWWADPNPEFISRLGLAFKNKSYLCVCILTASVLAGYSWITLILLPIISTVVEAWCVFQCFIVITLYLYRNVEQGRIQSQSWNIIILGKSSTENRRQILTFHLNIFLKWYCLYNHQFVFIRWISSVAKYNEKRGWSFFLFASPLFFLLF